MIFTFLCTSVPSAFIYGVAYAEEEGDIYDESASTGYVALKRGDRDGEDSANIVILQNKLIELGYLYDAADGVFGLNTESAVSAFQRSNGLEETGEVSPEMQELLYSGKPLVSAMDSTDPESVAYRVQDKLAMWGFLMDDPDGRIGAKTEEAIAAFQDYLSSYYWTVFPSPSPEPIATPAPGEPSGYADAAVAIDVPLKKEDTVEITEDILKYIDGDYNFEIYHETVSSGDSNLEVWRVQRRLYQLNYLPVVDGTYGADTERALLYFQKKNGLNQTAVADEATQRILFSNAAIKSEEFVCAYKLVVDVSEQRTYAYQWNGSNYGTCVREMICSTGLNDTPTPLGTYQAAGSTGTGEWYWFGAYNCYAKWAYRIVGGILFHSVIYSKGKKLNQTSVRKLGRKASHGCIRLKVEDAKWIYDTCPAGTTVVVQE
ncbi:MAG: murein L,D-transpeptidase [Clostridia bacterium]|nr:murein L,D-transpeptidase [Clostridia bacterium]